ncbi:hypothetical protein NQZ68_014045 [Dissostichus eleginoides]|nr:hypothetical protein NQZ68_014045 [Dissostichus eleginoides]
MSRSRLWAASADEHRVSCHSPHPAHPHLCPALSVNPPPHPQPTHSKDQGHVEDRTWCLCFYILLTCSHLPKVEEEGGTKRKKKKAGRVLRGVEPLTQAGSGNSCHGNPILPPMSQCEGR